MLERRFVNRLTSTVKEGVDVSLGPKVIVIGDPGTGKSSLVDAYSLVVTGSARSPGLGAGREILRHGGRGGASPSVTAQTNDGEILKWPRGEGEAPSGLDVTSEIHQALYGAPATLQAMIVRAMGRPDWNAAVKASSREELEVRCLKYTPTVFRPILTEVLEEVSEVSNLGIAIQLVLDGLDERLRARKVALKLAAIPAAESQPLTAEEEADLENLLKVFEHVPDHDVDGMLESLLFEGRVTQAALEVIQGKLISLREQKESLGSAHLAQLTVDLLRTLEATHGLMQRYGEGIGATPDSPRGCPLCGSTSTLEKMWSVGRALPSMIQQAGEKLAPHQAVQREIEEADQEESRLTAKLVTIKERMRALIPLKSIASGSPEDNRARRESLERRKANSASAQARSAETAEELTKSIEGLEAVRAAVKKSRAEIAGGYLEAASTRINRVLPPSIRVRVTAEGDKGQGCALMVALNGEEEHPFRLLGGVERALVTAAAAAAFCPPGAANINALIIDDVWMSRPAVTTLIKLVDEAIATPDGPSQAIISVVEYGGRIPDDWTVVRTSEAAQEDKQEDKPTEPAKPVAEPDKPAVEIPAVPIPPELQGGSAALVESLAPSESLDPAEELDAIDLAAKRAKERAAQESGPQEGSPTRDETAKKEAPPMTSGGFDPEAPPSLGTIKRAGLGEFPLYWLGEHKRVTDAVKSRLLKAADVKPGTLGVAVSGKTRKHQVFFVGSNGVRISDAVLDDAALREVMKKVSALLSDE